LQHPVCTVDLVSGDIGVWPNVRLIQTASLHQLRLFEVFFVFLYCCLLFVVVVIAVVVCLFA